GDEVSHLPRVEARSLQSLRRGPYRQGGGLLYVVLHAPAGRRAVVVLHAGRQEDRAGMSRSFQHIADDLAAEGEAAFFDPGLAIQMSGSDGLFFGSAADGLGDPDGLGLRHDGVRKGRSPTQNGEAHDSSVLVSEGGMLT